MIKLKTETFVLNGETFVIQEPRLLDFIAGEKETDPLERIVSFISGMVSHDGKRLTKEDVKALPLVYFHGLSAKVTEVLGQQEASLPLALNGGLNTDSPSPLEEPSASSGTH